MTDGIAVMDKAFKILGRVSCSEQLIEALAVEGYEVRRSLKDQIIQDAVWRHCADIERSLEKLVAEGMSTSDLALQQTIEETDDFTMKITTNIVRTSTQ